MKKLLTTLMCCMIFLSIPITAYAAKDETDTYEYEVRDGRAVLTRYATGSNATRVTVPNEVDGYEVIGLEGTFKENQRLEKIEIPEGIEYLGDETFLKCRKLKNIKLPDTLTEIGTHCFERSNIFEIKIPDSVENIGNSAFSMCENLREINLKNLNIDVISWEMFDGCSNLKKAILPNSIKVIEYGAFSRCISLDNIDLPNSLIEIGGLAFEGCSGLMAVELPISLNRIGMGAFYDCGLIEELIIPRNVIEIESDFYGVISGVNLKRIVNQTNRDFDKTIYRDSYLGYAWYLSETGDEIAEFLPANSTIYRRKIENKPNGSDNPGVPDAPDNPDMPDTPSDDKEKIKIQEIELSITCTNPNENISPENLAVDFKTEHCHVKEINVTRYNKANVIIVPDDGYIFSKVIDEWANISGIDVEIERVRARSNTSGNISEIHIGVINAASTEPSEGDSTQILFDKYTDSISNEIEVIRKEKIKMSDANSEESVKEYITQRLSKFSNDMFEFEVIVEDSDYGLEEFRPAEAGTAKIPKGRNGYCFVIVRIWIKDDKETLIKIKTDITIKATEYENSHSGGSGGSGSGSSSGGGSSSKSESSSNTVNIIITKNNVIMGIWEQIEGKWKLKISDGSYASSQWAMLEGKWYLLGSDGFMLTGWQMVNGKWYYLGADGAMLAGAVTPDGYAVNENGEWIQ